MENHESDDLEEVPEPLNVWHLHEIVDRTLMLATMFEQFVQDYPGLSDQYPELGRMAEEALSNIYNLYQAAAVVMDDLGE